MNRPLAGFPAIGANASSAALNKRGDQRPLNIIGKLALGLTVLASLMLTLPHLADAKELSSSYRCKALRQNSPPNVIVILADDLGWGDLSCYGNPFIPTPNIDSIARDGIRFTAGYVTCPQCAPSRTGLMTGRYPQRFGIDSNENCILPLNQPTLAERLKPYGYATSTIGKWNLGTLAINDATYPLHRGFDEFFGFLATSNGYLPSGPNHIVRGVLRGITGANEHEYLTDAIGREAASFIRRQSGPFCLYVPFNAPHTPLEATPQDLAAVNPALIGNDRTRAAMILAMDRAVGQLLSTVHDAGQDENTLIFFLSDNGGTVQKYNAPFKGGKLHV